MGRFFFRYPIKSTRIEKYPSRLLAIKILSFRSEWRERFVEFGDNFEERRGEDREKSEINLFPLVWRANARYADYGT